MMNTRILITPLSIDPSMGRCQIGLPGRRDQVGAFVLSCS
jgi:hypothetical protein